MAKSHYHLRPERPFVRQERAATTVLVGGTTWAQQTLVEASLRGIGYHVETLPVEDLRAYELGRVHCSNGLCNPAYFTIGNLLRSLSTLRDQRGLSAEQICERYVYVTAGSYGPCRFGMYESEYRFALESAGFADFRVLVFQQMDGLLQSRGNAGLEFDAQFFLAILRAFMTGDLLNDLYHQIRPFEVEAGAADAARRTALMELRGVMRTPPRLALRRAAEALANRLGPRSRAAARLRQLGTLGVALEHLRDRAFLAAVARAVRHFDRVRTDRLQLKPVVKVTGEFWAQMTEGDGNFRLFDSLEQQGAEVLVEPLTTWIDYLIHSARITNRERRGLPAADKRGPLAARWSSALSHLRAPLHQAALDLAERALWRYHDALRAAAGGVMAPLVDQRELEHLAAPFYDSRLYGGEGHLEIGKTIHYTQEGLAHMVLSVKPFGCMPSTQSDGAQPAVLGRFPDILFAAIETSADGEGAAMARVQMLLADARQRARDEWRRFVDQADYTLPQIRQYAAEHPALGRGLLALPRGQGWTTTAVRFADHVCQRMRAEGVRREVAPAQVEALAGELEEAGTWTRTDARDDGGEAAWSLGAA